MKNFQKLVALFIVVLLLFSLAACGKKASNGSNSNNNDSGNENGGDKNNSNNNNDGNNSMPSGVNLPDGYPADFVPIMENAISGSGMKTGENNFMVSYTTPSSREEVFEFYSKAFEKYGDAVSIADNKREFNLEADGWDATIFIDSSGANTSLRISVFKADDNQGNNGDDGNNDDNNNNNDNDNANEELKNVIALIDGAEVVDEVIYKDEYTVSFNVNKSYQEVVDFYKNILKSATDVNVEEDNIEFYATAIKDNCSVEIQVITEEDNTSQCTVLINIYSNE